MKFSQFLKKFDNLRWFLGLASLFIFFYVILSFTIQFTAWPEMLAYPKLISQGFLQYHDIILPYLPLLPVLLFFYFSVVGYSVFTLHIFALFVNILSGIVIFLIVKRNFNKEVSFFSCAVFLALQFYFEGNTLWFDNFSLLFILLVYYFLFLSKKKIFFVFAGIFFAAAFLIKQTNIIFILPILFQKRKELIEIVFFMLGVIPSTALVIFPYLISQNRIDFIYWALLHPVFFHHRLPGFKLPPSLTQIIIILLLFLPAFIFLRRRTLYIWFFISFIFALPRFGYFHLHHSAAFFALLFPFFLTKKNIVYVSIYSLIFFRFFVPFIVKNAVKPPRFFEPNIAATTDALVQELHSEKSIYFLNVPANYFILTDLPIVKPWADTFPWYLEVPGLQGKIINSITDDTVVVLKPFQDGNEYDLGSYKPMHIYSYIMQHYHFSKELPEGLQVWRR